MGAVTGIQWTDHTWNPWIGCTRVSAGCVNCYAETLMDKRYHKVQWGKGKPRKRTSAAYWKEPLTWNAMAALEGRPHRVFAASLADVFDAEVDPRWREDFWALVRATPYLIWQVLTKRPENFKQMLPEDWAGGYDNVWLGITAENEEAYLLRWPLLKQTFARCHFISYEPALGPFPVEALGAKVTQKVDRNGTYYISEPYGRQGLAIPDWIIAGGESGSGRREYKLDWFHRLRLACEQRGIAFFMKQLDKVTPVPENLMTQQFPYFGY